MRKTIVIAVREYQAAVRTKAFVITMVLMPVLMGGSVAVQLLLRDKVDTKDKRVAILDETGVVYDGIADVARARNAKDIFKGQGADRRQVLPRFVIERVETAGRSLDETRLELSERVRNNDLFAFLTIPAEVIEPHTEDTRPKAAYHSNSPTYEGFRKWVAGPINKSIHRVRLESLDLDPEVVEQATRYTRVSNLGLVSLDDQGNVTQAEEINEAVTIGVPAGLMMLMFMVILICVTPLMQSVLEEKMQRIAEVLLGSVPPFQLMMGKLLGAVGVSLTIGTVYLVGAFYALHRTGYGSLFPAHVVWWFVLYLGLAILMFGSLFIAVGAAVTDMKESQSLITPVTILVMAPLFVWLPVLREPNSTFSTVLSLIPPFTPMLMLIRQAIPPGVPLWQPAMGVALMLLTTTACVFVAGRVFRVGILMQGQGANLGQILRWVIRG